MNNIDQLIVLPQTTIIEAMHQIDSGSVQIVLVVDEARRLLGTITDGDIRRGILRGVPLDSAVDTIMNASPKYAHVKDSREAIFGKMKRYNLRQVPVLDEEERVVRLDLMDEMLKLKNDRVDNWVVLMAGGLGTRLSPLTNNCPKPLLKIGEKPILEVILDNFIMNGFHRFMISVNYKAEMIIDYFGDGSKWGVEIQYIHETKRLGTAGALSLLPFRPTEPLLVMNGDLLTKVNFRQMLDFHNETVVQATMCVREYEYQVPYGVVKADNYRLISIEEKPHQRYFISGGIYVIQPEAMDLIPLDTFYDMPNLFSDLIAEGKETAVFPIREYWIDIGRIDDFERANAEHAKGII
ncbi:nucleotidyltransferase family protein [Paenibacillus sp. PR3]|uniref:Nucleotidyltransferase family protein n=1 Tax=Paenibacillus terricola TaxID=2763503 RepID=A0ABR8N0G6_9BACL|nr:nucleotidyltransferase family protein [Paenibacillus terricola]MBD3920700.1 nucleotidyltransferase family protein [Paenibacillus terricola]